MNKENYSKKISFKKLQENDLTTIWTWLQKEHVAHWYNSGTTFEEVQQKYRAYINGKRPTHGFIVEYNHVPIGYIQCYRIDDYPEWQHVINIYENACGVDMFIGNEHHVGKGIGSSMLKKFLHKIAFNITKTDACYLGPNPENKAAIRAYEKVGFEHVKTIENNGELEYIMRITQKSST